MKASRLLSILMLLQARGRLSAPALAQALEVSTRTVLRDIDQLSAAGVPVWGERGRQGGFQLREGWSTQLTGMTEAEAHALLLAGLPGPATELGLGSAAASARLKMLASLPNEWRDRAELVGERLHIDPIDWYRSSDTPNFLREVADAVWQSRGIVVDYDSWRGTAQHELEPLGLVLKAGAWYLLARRIDATAVRTFRLASLLALKPTGHAFVRPQGFDLPQAWRESAARFEAELRRLPARMLVSPRAIVWLRNERMPFTVLPGEGSAPPDRADWCEVVLPLESVEQGVRQLLGWVDEVEVLAPAELRIALASMAARLVELYRRSDSQGKTLIP